VDYYAAWPEMAGDRIPAELLELTPTLQRFAGRGHVVDKPVLSPWWSGDLHRHLRSRGVDTLVITGGETEVCVLATVMGAIDLGYHIILPTDALCSSAESCHSAMLSIYGSRFGSHLSTSTIDEVLEQWR
jgi:nicotinamidase-related amidase